MDSVSSGYNSDTISEIDVDNVSSLILDVNIDKDKTSFAPVDIEVQILNERLKSILEQIVTNIEIVIFLNTTREFEIRPLLRDVVSVEDLEVICDEAFYVGYNDFPKMTYTIITKQMMDEEKEQPECKILPELTQVFNTFAKYPEIKPIVKLKVHEKIQKPPDTIAFLRAMYRFKTKVEDRLTMPATEKLKRDVMQRNLKKTNQMLKEKLSEINQKLQEEKDAFQEIFHEKNEMKKHHQNELSMLKSECVTIIKKKIIASERQMMKETGQHQLEYGRLVEQEDKIKMEYDDMLKLHMTEEDTLRAKRFKIETTLTSWLQKYDKEVGDRQYELDELTRLYEEEKEALADLNRRFNEQEERYTPLIKMKKDEEAAIFAYNFNRFRTNYAATKIQRWWRAILKKSKKKKKKRR